MESYLSQLCDVKLIHLVQSQSPNVIYQVLQSYGNLDQRLKLEKINEVDKDGYTALHSACARGIPEIVDILLQNGVNVHAVNTGGESAVHLAAKRGNPIVLKMLRDSGADFDVVDTKGQGVAHHAIFNDNVFVLLWIETSTTLSLNAKDSLGQTPLHLTCILGKVNSMKFLLRKSRSNVLEKTSKTRDTCLHLAIVNHQLQCVPHILFETTTKKSFNVKDLQREDESSIVLSKNSEKKTPVDLFMDQTYEYKNSHRSFWYFFLLLQMTSLTQLKINFSIYRLYLFLFPLVSFSIAIAISMILVRWTFLVFLLASLLCTAYTRLQSHRVSDIDTRPNPIFAGAYVAGVCHDLLCFMVNVYPHMHGSEWEIALTVVTLPLLILAYARLMLVDPGRLQLSEVANTNFSEFVDAEVAKQRKNGLPSHSIPLDRFCKACELLPAVAHVKHCKLCGVCVVDLDHHCLFLMTCVGRNNLRNFVFLIVLSITLIVVFIETSIKALMLACGPLAGANPLEFAVCSCRSRAWLSTAVLFNAVSAVWASVMLLYQLTMVSYNSTAYFHQGAKRASYVQRAIRVLYFLRHGSFYRASEGDPHVAEV